MQNDKNAKCASAEKQDVQSTDLRLMLQFVNNVYLQYVL